MKLPDIRTTVAAACAFLALQATITPAHAYTLEIKGRHEWNGFFYGYNENQPDSAKIFVSFHDTPITGDDGNETTTRIFYIAGIDADICSDITLPESVHFPQNDDYIELSGKTVAMTGCGYQESGFSWTDDNDSYLTITVPGCYIHMTGDFLTSSRIREITLEASAPAIIWGNPYGGSPKIIVNDNDVAAYRVKCDNNEDGWQSSFTIFAKSHRTKKTDVNSNAGGLYDAVKAVAGDDLRDVYNLRITGTIQPSDMNVFPMLSNLLSLDISGATVEMSDAETAPYIWDCGGLSWLESVTLGSDITEIYDNAFNGCGSLREINLGDITKIGKHAFSNCGSLTAINLDNTVSIGDYAFGSCDALTEINIPKIESISDHGFGYCHNLREVNVGTALKYIGYNAFSETGLDSFDIPFGCQVSEYVFSRSSVRELTVRDNSGIGERSFQGMNALESFKCYDPYPYQGTLDMSRDNNTAPMTLYVPEFALDFYNTETYKGFISHKPLEEDIDYIDVIRPMEIATTKGIADPVTFRLPDSATYSDYYNSDSRYGSFTNKSTEAIHISKLTQNASYRPAYNYGIEIQIDPTSTFISNGEVTADNMEVNLRLLNGSQTHEAWNFISFPFNVNMKEIKTPEDALWTMMRYDGKIRATRNESEEQSQSAWVKLLPETNSTDAVLKAGQGYILHYVLTSDNHADPSDGPFTFSWNSAMGSNTAFSNENVKVALAKNDAVEGFEHNSSWNLVGNPYDAFFLCRHNIKTDGGDDYMTPITMWRYLNGNYTYEAFSLVDDNFALRHFEAFFVQKLNDSDMTFRKEGRHDATKINELVNAPNQTEMPALSAGGSPRSIFNIHITGASGADRTRLVVNDEASADYEIACDASKFFSMSDAPQIFTTQGSVSYAINERPFGNGEYPVGVRISSPGSYTVSADSRNSAGYTVELVDNRSSEVTDLNEHDYTFTSEAGSDNARFTLRLTRGSGVETVDAQNAGVSVEGSQISVTAPGAIAIFAIDGKTVAEGFGAISATLPAGVYVVKAGNMVKKAVIGK